MEDERWILGDARRRSEKSPACRRGFFPAFRGGATRRRAAALLAGLAGLAAMLALTVVSALPAEAAAVHRKAPAITTSYDTRALSAVGRETDITITSSGNRPLHITSIVSDGENVPIPCVGAWLRPGATCVFTVGWSGGPGGGPNGPEVTIVSNAATSPTVIAIPYQ